MANNAKSVTRKGLALAGVVIACVVLGFYAALAPTKKNSTLGDAAKSTGSQPEAAEVPSAPSQELNSFSDLPKREVVVEITRRAVRDALRVHKGFLPSVSAVTDCYKLMASDDLEQRIFCIQLDGAAWAVDCMAPPAWRAKAAAANDYFTDSRFRERQLRFALPLSTAPELVLQKQRFLSELGEVLTLAMRQELEKEFPTESKEEPSQRL